MPAVSKSVLRKVTAALALTGAAQGLNIRSQHPLSDDAGISTSPASFNLSDVVTAAKDLQQNFFDSALGNYIGSPDWTTAVFGTHLAAIAKTISNTKTIDNATRVGIIEDVFQDILLYYSGQNFFGIFFQAYDDILWVVLNWLEASTFVQIHSTKYYNGTWHGERLLGAFSHRARVFWDAASPGWDETACGGGMTWNPNLPMYKNAITNELWIAASASMYINFAGDDNAAPIAPLDMTNHRIRPPAFNDVPANLSTAVSGTPIYPAHDPRHLEAAIRGYTWLMNSGMRNALGLFIDGFHLSDDGTRQCTKRDTTVWSYNQGVLLTGQRYLWQATGAQSYLDDGHELIRNVIQATGWDLATSTASDDPSFQGLGRLGVIEEPCDQSGRCNPDQQAFKGIFFHHYNTFCHPLPQAGSTEFGAKASAELAALHAAYCASYGPWIEHNARAAMSSRDAAGLFGMWWNQHSHPATKEKRGEEVILSEVTAADILGTNYWTRSAETAEQMEDALGGMYQSAWGMQEEDLGVKFAKYEPATLETRSAETQSGGVAVLRAAVEQGMR